MTDAMEMESAREVPLNEKDELQEQERNEHTGFKIQRPVAT